MREAIRLGEDAMRANRGGPFGCVVVRKGRIVARGENRVTSGNDPTAHAEVTAIREACRSLGVFRLDDCELYTSCEPCPMCLAAIYWARIPRVYYGNTRADAAAIGPSWAAGGFPLRLHGHAQRAGRTRAAHRARRRRDNSP